VKRYKETKNSLLLAKCLRQRLWDDSAHQLKQLPGIGAVTVKVFLTKFGFCHNRTAAVPLSKRTSSGHIFLATNST
jgi:hypothetical protein